MNNDMILTILLNKKKMFSRYRKSVASSNLNKKDSSNHKALVNILPIQPSSQSAIHFFSTYPNSGCVSTG